MDTQTLQSLINQLRATEARSLVDHVDAEATPYLSATTYPMWKTILKMGHDSDEREQQLEAILVAIGLPVLPVNFETAVTCYHFVTLESLIPAFIAEKQLQLSLYEEAIAAAGNSDVADSLAALQAQSQEQLDQLEAFNAKLPTVQAQGYHP